MKDIIIEDVSYEIEGHSILNDISFKVRAGELFTILGPSGCGKTTLLRLIAGLEKAGSGCIYLGEKCVSSSTEHLPAEEREVGLIFQNYALFPHMTVRENIVFGIDKSSQPEVEKVFSQLMNLIGLKEHLKQYPHQLSGGEQQRVALVRALVRQPKILLMDEPFSNLDPELKKSLLYEVKKILRELKITTVMVSHSQEEAFDFADRIAILRNGRVVQVDFPVELYENPVDRFVADFVGTTSWLKGSFCQKDAEGVCIINTELGEIRCQSVVSFSNDDNVDVMLRPENVVLSETGGTEGLIKAINYRGSHMIFEVSLENGDNLIGHSHGEIPTIGSKVSVEFVPRRRQPTAFMG